MIEYWVTNIESLRSTALEKIWTIRLRVILEHLKKYPYLFNRTPGPSSHPTRLLSSFSLPKLVPYKNLGQLIAAHISSIVTTESLQSTA
ncbi:hypothetical protein TNCV_1187071 [Trichonephila clavipes]|nr:hypothetical protein TNCV_1187071 [Trichonephila clavipes]